MNSHDLLTKKDLEEFKNEVFDFISNYLSPLIDWSVISDLKT